MATVYESLKEVVQETLQLSKPNSTVFRVKGSDASRLNHEMEKLERILVDRIGRLKTAVKDGEAVVADEAQHAEQVIESLRANLAVLEAKLKETEDTGRRKDSASQRMEQSLTAQIQDLQSEVKKKEQVLESRGSEINHLKTKIDVLVNQVTHLEQAVEQTKATAASEAQRAEDLTESSKAKIATLEAQLRESEEIVRGKDSTIKGLEQNLAAKIQDFESQVKNKERLLADRDRQVNDLKSEVKLLTKGIKEMSSFFKQAEALADIQAQDIGTVVAGEPLKTEKEKPASSRFQDVGVASNLTDAAGETVSRADFDRMIGELGEVTNVIRPIASLGVHDNVAALGESMEKFPKTRLTELLDSLSGEVSDEKLKIGFRERLGKL